MALKSFWSFCDLVVPSNINNELKASSPHFHNSKLPLDNDHLSTTATNFGSQVWSLYTRLTVCIEFLKTLLFCHFWNTLYFDWNQWRWTLQRWLAIENCLYNLFTNVILIEFQDQKRGRMENSFTAIGSSVICGAGFGGAYGLYDGVRQSALSGMSGKLRRTQILNHTLKSGARMSNALGSLAVIYR